MIRALAGVTIVTPDLDVAAAAYATYLGYTGAAPTCVGDDLAREWGVPQAASARMVVLRPASGEARFIRLVEGIPAGDFAALTSYGWTAVEIVVRDVDRLATQLADSPFRIIGPPAVLEFDFTDQLKAMQVVGPGGEVIYLTQIDGVIPGFDLPVAHSFVGQPFIMVLASPDIATAGAFYAGFGRPVGPTMAAPIAILSHAHDLAPDYRHNLATVALDDASLIEIDASPAGTVARPLSSIGLPCGVAMVSLHGAVPAAKPDGSRLAKGNAGEWVEIVA
jgi:hypothetical protein